MNVFPVELANRFSAVKLSQARKTLYSTLPRLDNIAAHIGTQIVPNLAYKHTQGILFEIWGGPENVRRARKEIEKWMQEARGPAGRSRWAKSVP